jgi:hypothetical protein
MANPLRQLDPEIYGGLGPPLTDRGGVDREGELVMTDEEKQSILASAKATIDRRRAVDGLRDAKPPRERVETNIKYRRTDPEPPPPEERNLTDAEMLRWRQYFEAYVVGAIRSERAFITEVVGGALGEKMNELRDEIESYVNAKFAQATNQRFVDLMKLSLDELKTEIKKLRGGLIGEVSDLPNPQRHRQIN